MTTSRPNEFDNSDWTIPKDSKQLSEEPIECFKTLLPHAGHTDLPNLPNTVSKAHAGFLYQAWTRFENNNFVLHKISSLESNSGAYAHGIFPQASRSFNHSCSPNAWPAFVLEDRQVWLEIRALANITEGEEVGYTRVTCADS